MQQIPNTSDISDSSDMSDADVSDMSDMTDMTDMSDMTDMTDMSDMSDIPDIPVISEYMSNQQLSTLLTSSGNMQQELFRKAREIRRQYLGNEIKLRGVIEISNICQKNCDYCAMRYSNKSLKRFRLDKNTIMATVKNIIDAGITTVFLQGGQDPHYDRTLEEVIPAIVDELKADIILNIGERSKETYEKFVQLGAKSFILKYETSDTVIYENIAHDSLDKRLQCMEWIRGVGMKIGTGNIVGLPHQSIDSLASDIKLILKFKPDFASSSPFISNKGTPLQDHPLGDINLTINTIAILRIGLKNAHIPSVSALEYVHPGGQLMGLNAGANVMTINFTPQLYRENYNIYTKDRFIVSLSHAINTAKKAGLKIDPKINSKMTLVVVVIFALVPHFLRFLDIS